LNFNKKYSNIIHLLLAIIILFSCSKSTENVIINRDFSYYPQKVGKWINYQVQEIHIDAPSNIYDTTNYQIKELFESTFIDNSGDICFRIERYKRINDSSPWEIKDVWVSKLNNNFAIKIEENLAYVKILFPAETNKVWNGNIYNTGDYSGYHISDLNEKEIINANVFDSVLTVVQRDDENLIEKYLSVEKYGKNIGLIFRQNININSLYIIPGESYNKKIKTGTIYLQQIINYGNT
jgi:hypothetical protein